MTRQLSDLIPELVPSISYQVLDLFSDGQVISSLTAAQNLTLSLAQSTESVRMVKLVPN